MSETSETLAQAAVYDPEKLAALRLAWDEHIDAAESGDPDRYKASFLAYNTAHDACGPAEMAELVKDCPF